MRLCGIIRELGKELKVAKRTQNSPSTRGKTRKRRALSILDQLLEYIQKDVENTLTRDDNERLNDLVSHIYQKVKKQQDSDLQDGLANIIMSDRISGIYLSNPYIKRTVSLCNTFNYVIKHVDIERISTWALHTDNSDGLSKIAIISQQTSDYSIINGLHTRIGQLQRGDLIRIEQQTKATILSLLQVAWSRGEGLKPPASNIINALSSVMRHFSLSELLTVEAQAPSTLSMIISIAYSKPGLFNAITDKLALCTLNDLINIEKSEPGTISSLLSHIRKSDNALTKNIATEIAKIDKSSLCEFVKKKPRTLNETVMFFSEYSRAGFAQIVNLLEQFTTEEICDVIQKEPLALYNFAQLAVNGRASALDAISRQLEGLSTHALKRVIIPFTIQDDNALRMIAKTAIKGHGKAFKAISVQLRALSGDDWIRIEDKADGTLRKCMKADFSVNSDVITTIIRKLQTDVIKDENKAKQSKILSALKDYLKSCFNECYLMRLSIYRVITSAGWCDLWKDAQVNDTTRRQMQLGIIWYQAIVARAQSMEQPLVNVIHYVKSHILVAAPQDRRFRLMFVRELINELYALCQEDQQYATITDVCPRLDSYRIMLNNMGCHSTADPIIVNAIRELRNGLVQYGKGIQIHTTNATSANVDVFDTQACIHTLFNNIEPGQEREKYTALRTMSNSVGMNIQSEEGGSLGHVQAQVINGFIKWIDHIARQFSGVQLYEDSDINYTNIRRILRDYDYEKVMALISETAQASPVNAPSRIEEDTVHANSPMP